MALFISQYIGPLLFAVAPAADKAHAVPAEKPAGHHEGECAASPDDNQPQGGIRESL